MTVLMQPTSTHNQQCSEHACKHAGILACFDVAENASNEAANTAEESDREKDYTSQNQDVGDWGVSKMVHAFLLAQPLNEAAPEKQGP